MMFKRTHNFTTKKQKEEKKEEKKKWKNRRGVGVDTRMKRGHP
jgi:hypothetical protein